MKFIYLLIIIVLGVLTHWLWFSGLSVITSGDWGFFIRETQKEFLALPQMWTANSFGSVYLSLSMYPSNLLWGLLAQVTDFAVSERVLYLFPCVLIGGITAYFLVSKLTKSNIGGFVGGVVYAFNSYFILLQASGHLTLLVAYAFAPLLILVVIKALQDNDVKTIILAALLAFLMGFYEFRILFLTLVIASFYFLYFWVVIKNCSLIAFQTVLKLGLVFLMILTLLNSYWLAMWFTSGQGQETLFGGGLFGDSFMNIIRAMTLFHPFWTWNTPIIFVVQEVPVYYFIIPLAAIFGVWFNRRNKIVLFFGLISLLGILITKQSSEPFPGLYKWLYSYLPGFQAFRESSKFYFFIALGYSVLIGAFVACLWNCRKVTSWWFLAVKGLITVLIVLVFLGNTWPLITGRIGTMFVPKKMPGDYLLINKFLSGQKDFFRTLWVPADPRWVSYLNNQPKVSLLVAEQTAWKDQYQSVVKDSAPVQSQIASILDMPGSARLLDVSAIKYVFVPFQDFGNDEDFFQYYGPRWFFLDAVNKASYLKKLDLGTKEVAVYENEGSRPHLYITSTRETIQTEVPYSLVESREVRPTEYHLKLSNLQEKRYLNFSESYNSGWRVRVGNFSWWEALFSKNYYLPESIHTKSDAGLNSFELSPSINKTGDKVDVTLYFAPQSYVYVGAIVSAVTLVVCLLYLGTIGFKRIYGK